MSVKLDAAQIEQAEKVLSHISGGVSKAASRAINRAVEASRAAAVTKIREDYYVAAGTVRDTMTIRRASPTNLFAMVRSSGKRMSLMAFRVRPAEPLKGGRRAIVKVAVKKTGYKPLRHAFVVRLKNSVGVFERTTKKRFPIKKLMGPAVPQMLGTDKVSSYVENKAQETLTKRFEHEVDRMLSGGK